MDEQERLELDRRMLEIIGWRGLRYDEDDEEEPWHGISPEGLPGCCHTGDCAADEALVAPLAKALRAKGWHVAVRSCWLSDQWAAQLLHGGREITEYADTMPLALALAAAKAVGERSEG